MDMLLGTFASRPLFIVRVVLGVIFFAHGAQKVFGWFGGPGLRGVIAYFKQALGVPAPLTVLAALTEFLGGLAMIVCSCPGALVGRYHGRSHRSIE
jgi:putative oxidoreductase